jgi:hypothetical protein
MMPLKVGYVVSGWHVKQRLLSATGQPLFLMGCLACLRSFVASEAQVANLKPCGCNDNDSPQDARATRLPLNLSGWGELP